VFNLGFGEMALILVIALLVFGPNKLPELARNLGKSLGEFRRASNDLRRSIMEADQPVPPPAPPRGPADEVAAEATPAVAAGPTSAKAPAQDEPGGPSA
jgi:TatA/E family protein of Tat protein translocase